MTEEEEDSLDLLEEKAHYLREVANKIVQDDVDRFEVKVAELSKSKDLEARDRLMRIEDKKLEKYINKLQSVRDITEQMADSLITNPEQILREKIQFIYNKHKWAAGCALTVLIAASLLNVVGFNQFSFTQAQQEQTFIPPPRPFEAYTDNGPNETAQIRLPVMITKDSLGAIHIVSEVINNGQEPAKYVEITATFYNIQNQVIGTKSTFTAPGTIFPKQVAPFELIVGFGDAIPVEQIERVKFHLDWRDSLQLTETHPLGAKAQSQNCNTHCLFESSFAKQIGVTKDTNEKWAFMEIDSDTNWQGSVLDTSMKSETKAGSGEGTIPFECSSFGTYSLVMQKQTEDGSLRIKVVRNGNLLKEGSTTAPYGLVSLAGQC